jgi:hypothetical protein
MLDGGYTQSRSGGGNFAPVEPLRELERDEDSYKKSSFVQTLREWHQEVRGRHVQERREIAEMARAMSNIRSGKLVMKRDPIYGGIALLKPLPHKPRSDKNVYPLAQTNSSQLTSIWTMSRPKILPRHFGNTNKAQIQHALIEQVIEHYDTEFFDEYFSQKESLSMMDWGTSIIRVFYDDRLNQIKQLLPVIENRSQTLFDGYGYCMNCPKEGTPDDFNIKGEAQPRCPDCGSYKVSDLIPAQSVQVPAVVGARTVTQGDIGIELLRVGAANWDMRKLVRDSDFFHYRSEVPVNFVRSILGCSIEETGPEQDEFLGVLNAIGTRGGSMEGWGRENAYGHPEMRTRSAIMDEHHFAPDWYAGIKLSKAEKTVSGGDIPANVPLEEVFPDGISVVGFNDMTVIAHVCGEKRHVESGVYHIQSESGVGKGTTDTIEIAEQLNSAHSANLAMIKRYGAGGGYWFDKDVMTETQAKKLLKPGGLVGISMRGTNYTSVEAALQQIRHGELSNSNLTMVAQLANMMNIAFQTTEFTSGVANENVNVNTATGQQMLQAQNQQRSAAPLRMKGWQHARVHEHALELFRENVKYPKFIGSRDRFSISKGKSLTGTDLPEMIRCDFVADSEQPANTMTKRQNAQQMLESSVNFGVPFVQVAQAMPQIAAWWAGLFGTDIPLYNQNEILIVCQDRLDNLTRLAAQADQLAAQSGFYPPTDELGNQMVDELDRKLFLDEESHTLKAQTLAGYLDDDATLEWSPAMRAGVEALIARHYQYERDAKYRTLGLDQEGQLAMQTKAMQAQMAAQQPMIDQQNAQLQQQQGQQMVQEGLGRAADMIDKEDDFDREQEAADKDHQRQLELKAAEQQHDHQTSRADFARDRAAASEDHKRNIELETKRNANRPKPGKR